MLLVCVVINVVGVWVGEIDLFLRLCFSCGIYLVFDVKLFVNLIVVLIILIFGELNCFVFVMFE